MCPQKQFFGFKSDGMGFFEKKNLTTVFGTPFSKKKVIFFFCMAGMAAKKKRKQDFGLTGAIIKQEGNLKQTILKIKHRSV